MPRCIEEIKSRFCNGNFALKTWSITPQHLGRFAFHRYPSIHFSDSFNSVLLPIDPRINWKNAIKHRRNEFRLGNYVCTATIFLPFYAF